MTTSPERFPRLLRGSWPAANLRIRMRIRSSTHLQDFSWQPSRDLITMNTPLRQKRSESGEALVLTIAVIGLAIIVTAAAFLLAARTGQDTERLASAKVDIATREDTLMRAILQETATGILPSNGLTGPSLDWTTIMTNAVNQVKATTYVDPSEAANLLGPGVIPANMGDPDDGSSSLSIFKGYQQEVPWGGTTGLSNLVNSANTTAVQPPQLVW